MSPSARDPYVYPGTNVLINLKDHRDQAALNRFEADAVAVDLIDLKRNPIQGPFDTRRLQETHRRIFAKVYPWAGELRKDIGLMAKNRSGFVVAYGPSQNVPGALACTFATMQAIKRMLAKHARLRLDVKLEDSIEINAQQRSAEDFKDGVEVFIQKRKPGWPSLKAWGWGDSELIQGK
jgi:fido (protein-threonine AMPylation protein)